MLTWQNDAFSLGMTVLKPLGENITVFAFSIDQKSKNSRKKKV
jgi:hypothetical protein